tara:strand:- start:2596 stop:5331 length:2736 start_codon:yes stop_codon:yes gene_type:complete
MVKQKAPSPPEIFGLKVSDISSAIGWGAQGGTCSLTLIDEGEPPSHAARVDESSPTGFTAGFRRQPPTTSGTGTPTVDGFPPAGTACGFNFREFSFGGVLQRWTYKESLSGRLYDIVLESPSKMLDGSQVILSDFEAGYDVNGNTNILKYEVKNVWNAFALFENREFGGFVGGSRGQFGASQVNEGGMPVDKLFEALEHFGSNGGAAGAPIFGGKLVFGESEYTIGFSELKKAVMNRAPFYRVKGPVQSINSIISDLCETVQIDYFIQLVSPSNGVIDNPHLEVRIVDKSQVSAGVVEQYVNSFKGQGIVVSTNYGEELQSSPTGKVLIGGPASRLVVRSIKKSPTALQVWDQLGDGIYVMGDSPDRIYGDMHAKVPIALQLPCRMPPNIQGALNTGGYKNLTRGISYTATTMELRMTMTEAAKPRSLMNWMVYKAFQIGAGVEPNGFTKNNWYGRWFINTAILWQAHLGNMPSCSALQTTKFFNENADFSKDNSFGFFVHEADKELMHIFESVKRVADNFYGQVFLVDLPEEPGGIDNNLRWIDPTFKTNYEASWEISDSAWAEDKPIRDVRFYDQSGKIQGYSAWDAASYATSIDAFGNTSIYQNVDFSRLGQDWGTDIGGFISAMKGGPNKDINWVAGNAYCIVNSGSMVTLWDTLSTSSNGMNVLSQLFFRNNNTGGRLNVVKGMSLDKMYLKEGDQVDAFSVAIPPDVLPPDYITIPQESTRYSWGPWYAVTNVANGSAEVEIDTSMVPETYGSVASMDSVGFGSVFAGLARTEAIETGNVELAQEPKFNLGDRFAASGPYVTGLDISISDGGVKTSYKFSTWTPTFGKLNKYNADRIARINKASIKFAKETRGPQGRIGNQKTAYLSSAKVKEGGGPDGVAGNVPQGQAVRPQVVANVPIGPGAV